MTALCKHPIARTSSDARDTRFVGPRRLDSATMAARSARDLAARNRAALGHGSNTRFNQQGQARLRFST